MWNDSRQEVKIQLNEEGAVGPGLATEPQELEKQVKEAVCTQHLGGTPADPVKTGWTEGNGMRKQAHTSSSRTQSVLVSYFAGSWV